MKFSSGKFRQREYQVPRHMVKMKSVFRKRRENWSTIARVGIIWSYEVEEFILMKGKG